MASPLGTQIRQARKDAEFKPAQFCVALEISPRTLQRWESGEGTPSVKQLVEIARVTAKPLHFFFEEVAA